MKKVCFNRLFLQGARLSKSCMKEEPQKLEKELTETLESSMRLGCELDIFTEEELAQMQRVVKLLNGKEEE